MEIQNMQPASGENDGMENIVVKLGIVTDCGDFRRSFRFKGKELAYLRTYLGASGHDDRGRDFTLYKVKNGYRVLICEWSRWQGEDNRCYMLGKELPDWDDDDWVTVWTSLKGDVLSGEQVAILCPAIWQEAVRIGAVEDIPENID
jgi:hypothetical protein